MAVIKENGKYKIKGKIKKDDGAYYNYKRIVPGAKKIGEARIYEVDFLRHFQAVESSRQQLSFRDLCTEYQENTKSIKGVTARTDKDVLDKACMVFGKKKINLITKDYLQKYVNELEEKYSKSYVSKFYYTIGKVINYAVDQEYILINPMKKVKRALKKDEIKQEMLFWEPDQFNQFISKVGSINMNTFFMFLYYMGCRKGEAMALQWKDINLSTGVVSIYKTVTNKIHGQKWSITSPKTRNSIRNISMPKNLKDALKRYRKEQETYYGFSEDCYVFGFDRPLAAESIRRCFRNNIKKANQTDEGVDLPFDQQIPEIRIHDLRHSHASFLINNMSNKFSDFDIAKRLGDTVQTLHDTYAHWFKQADKGIIEFMDAEIK